MSAPSVCFGFFTNELLPTQPIHLPSPENEGVYTVETNTTANTAVTRSDLRVIFSFYEDPTHALPNDRLMKKTLMHEISQPVTAIGNFATAARMLLEENTAASTALTAEERAKLILWMEQISRQTTRIAELIHEKERADATNGS